MPVSVNSWVALGRTPLDAVMVKVWTPAGIVPAKVPLPLPVFTKVTPAGSPVALRVATG